MLGSFSTRPTTMKTTDEAVPDQPSTKNEKHEKENSVTIPSKTSGENKTTLNTPKNTPVAIKEIEEVNQVITTVVTLKTSYEAGFSTDKNLTQQKIAVASTAVVNNNIITTPIAFQFHPPKDAAPFNVVQAHKHIFSAMKMIDETIKFITFDNKTIDFIDQFPDNQNYTTIFKDLHCKKFLKEFTSHTRLNRP